MKETKQKSKLSGRKQSAEHIKKRIESLKNGGNLKPRIKSEEERRKISEKLKRYMNKPETKKYYQERREKRKKELGYINSPETREKLSKIMKEKWKNGQMTERTKATMFKTGKDTRRDKTTFKIGHKVSEVSRDKSRKIKLNKTYEELYGKEKAEEIKEKASIRMSGINHPMFGKHLSKEAIEKMRLRQLGKKFPKELFPNHGMRGKTSNMKGKSFEEFYGKETSNSIKLKMKEKRNKRVLPKKDTSIEVKIQNYLKQLNIEFFTHQYIKEIEHGYQCDIMIPVQEGINQKTIIECFGTYWHNYPRGREIDTIRCNELRKEGWRVLVFWENEIHAMEVNELENKLEEVI